jgi:integrase
LAARWREIDLAGGVWCKPSSHTKTRKVHSIPLSQPALHLLASTRPAHAGQDDLVFPGVCRLHPLWRRVCAQAELPDCRIHDFPRRCRRFLGAL